MGSPQPVPAPGSGLPPGVESGDIGKRVVAYLIEWAAPAVIVWALSLIGALAQNVMVSLIISLVSFVAVIGWVVFVWWSYVTKAAGPGKQLMGLQVVGFSDGRPLPWGRVILRWLITGVIAGTGVGAIVLIILAVQNPRRQSLADQAVDSVVIKERQLAPKQVPGQQQGSVQPSQQSPAAPYQAGPAGPTDRGLFPPQEHSQQTPVRYGQSDRYGREQQGAAAGGYGDQSQQSPYPRQDQFGGQDEGRYGQDQYQQGRSDSGRSQPRQGQYGQDQYGQDQYGQDQHGQDQYAQNLYRPDEQQDAYGSARQTPSQYPQDQYGQQPGAGQYGQDQYQQGQYGQDQHGQDQHGQDQYGQDRYQQDQYQQDQYQQDQYQQDQYQQDQYQQDQYGQDQYQQDQYGQDRYGQDQRGYGQGGPAGSGVTPVAAPIPGATQFPAAPPPPVSGGSAADHHDPRPLDQGWRASLDDGREIEVSRLVLIGRNPQARPGEEDAQLIKISDETRTVSKTHLALGVDAGGMYVMDRGSTNGSTATDLDGQSRPCAPGDVVQVDAGTIVSFGDHWLEVQRP
ncbi:RDD family protein [Microlunatus speluncae]|uniref:RDD family protein n=1 Tax=Microlunatus speluncae TaxID=2594267 RepID=UPI0012666AD3|nr:RDD family protein [Microlunatus speluncae]